ncbi:MAG: HAD family hydrolase [Rhodospirillales bacterium]|jgi:phosphoglycolate phosphatase|nr:HAD family hydrolase [Rhodospirillales bacterium]
MTRPRAIIFDWDNTLIDSWAAIFDAQNHTLEAFGLPTWTMGEIRSRVRGSMRDTYPQLFGDRWREAGEVFYRRFAEKHLETLTPLAGSSEMLVELNAAGFYLAVVSNKRGDYLRQEAEQLGWSPLFGRIVGAFDAMRDKPAAEPVKLALDGSGVASGDEVWFAGDADIDLECAANTGCVPVLVRPEAPKRGEFDDFPPALHVTDCNALSKVLASL